MIRVGDTVELKCGSKYQGKLQNEVTSISDCGDYLRFNGKSSGNFVKLFKVVDTSNWHKHHNVITAWAKGAEVQELCFDPRSENDQKWCSCPYPRWEHKDAKFRIKPTEPTEPTELEKLKAAHEAIGKAIRKLDEQQNMRK